jgi:hypothetical protein
MPATIAVSRASTPWRDRFRSYELVVDGRTVARLKNGKSASVTVEPGDHRVSMRIDWCRSNAIDVIVGDGERASFECRPNGSIFLLPLYVTVFASRYLELERV